MNNWYELKSRCIDRVAREIARPRAAAIGLHSRSPHSEWAKFAKEAEPEAVEKIKAMNGLELLDLISEVAGSE